MVGSDTLLLALRGVSKRFEAVTALNRVDFDLRAGEIHALVGENGAGKSTLIKVLGGIYTPEAGHIWFEGRPVAIRCVADANRYGIRIIHQELSLAPNLTVAENIYLGREPHRAGWLLRRRMHEQARRLVRSLGLEEISDVEARVGDLSVAHQQLVEIARALSCHARVLVLDEPTSALSEAETEMLFAALHRLRAQGVGIIYISHRLEEVLRLADRITVLRDGRCMGTQPAGAVDQRQLVRWMVGRDIGEHYPRLQSRPGAVALEVCDLWGPKTFGVSFTVRYGEVLGLAGLVGSGRTELARLLFGVDPMHRGQVRVDGRPVPLRSPADALRAGIVLVPEDRKRQGLVTIQSVAFNLALPWVAHWIRGCWPNHARRQAIVQRAVRDFSIRLSDPEQGISSLSGGNQQKVMVARWMEKPPRVLILDEPTRGIDVGAREEMFRLLGQLLQQGLAVVLISSDLSEVVHLAHRVALLRDGRILDILPAQGLTLENVVARLTGAVSCETR